MYKHNYNANWLYGTFESDDELICELLEIYCLAHSAVWNLFFGWRRTNSKDIRTYYIPHSEFENVRLFIEEAID